ncbi:MAG: hypothetical protein ACK4QL_04615 [Pseudanabaenaceae cyanobacterium]
MGIYSLTEEIATAGELSAEELAQACQQGYKAVLNLRQAKEKFFFAE